MKHIFLSLIIIFSLSLSYLSADQGPINGDSTEVSAVIPANVTNTSPDLENIIAKTEEVKSLINQWQLVAGSIKTGSFSLGLLIFTIFPLLILSLITIGVLFIMLLRAIALFTSDEIDKKLLKIEEWITKYIIKIPITVLTSIRSGKKKK